MIGRGKNQLGSTTVLATCLCFLLTPAGWAMEVMANNAGSFTVKVTSLKEARFLSTMKQQYDFSCGSAAVATLLTHHYGRPTTEADVFQDMWKHGERSKIQREGFSLLDIKRYLERLGYQADGFQAGLEKLAEVKFPAIALIQENGYNHFVVIKGITDNRVLIGDPSSGTKVVRRKEFEALWASGVLFVIHSQHRNVRFNLASDWHVQPRAPLTGAISRHGLENLTLLRPSSSDF